jgi:formiminotetrahydrofolate cyclodeaminase
MSDLLQMSVAEFVTSTGARQPTPGGGSVAALAGALAASLAAMALRYTVGKKAYVAYEVELTAALAQFETAAQLLQELIAEDVAAYEALSQMLKLPEAARLTHADYVPTVVAAIRAPETTAAMALNILTLASTLLEKTNKMLVSDLGIAAVYAHATVHASELNVRVNLPLLPNRAEAEAMKQNLHDLSAKADKAYEIVRTHLLKTL